MHIETRNQYCIILSRIISELGTWVFNFAISLYVLDKTNSVEIFSLVLALVGIPAIFINLFAGVYVDKNNKKKILLFCELSSGIVAVILGALFYLEIFSLYIIVGAAIILSAIQSIFTIALNSSVRHLASENKAAKMNSALQAVGAVILIAGPPAGALLYNSTKIEIISLLNALSFLLSGLIILLLKFNTDANKTEIDKNAGYFANIHEVIDYLRGQKIIKFLLMIAMVLQSIINPLLVMALPFIIYKVLGLSAAQLSVIQVAAASGTIMGAVFLAFARNHNKYIRIFLKLIVLQAIVVLLMIFPAFLSADTNTAVFITLGYSILVAMLDFIMILQSIPLLTYFQLNIPTRLFGRVFSFYLSALAALVPATTWALGQLLKYIDWVYVLICLGLILSLVFIIAGRNKIVAEFLREFKKNSSEESLKNEFS